MNFIKKNIFNFNSQQENEEIEETHFFRNDLSKPEKSRFQQNDFKIIQSKLYHDNAGKNKNNYQKSINQSLSQDKIIPKYSTTYLNTKNNKTNYTNIHAFNHIQEELLINHTSIKINEPIQDDKLSRKRRNNLNLFFNSVDIKENKMKKFWSHHNKISISMNFLTSNKKSKIKEEVKKDIPLPLSGKKILNSSSFPTQSDLLSNLKFGSNELKDEKRLEDSQSKSRLLVTVRSITNMIMKKNKPTSLFNNFNQKETSKRNPTPITSSFKEKEPRKKAKIDKKIAKSERLSLTPTNITINHNKKPLVITPGPYDACSNLKYQQEDIVKKTEKISPIQGRKLANEVKKLSNKAIYIEISPGDVDDTNEFLTIEEEDKIGLFNDETLFKRLSYKQQDQSQSNVAFPCQKEIKSQSFTFPSSKLAFQINPSSLPQTTSHQLLNHHKSQSHSQAYHNVPIKLQSIPKLTIDIHDKDIQSIIHYLQGNDLISLSLISHKFEKITRKARYSIIFSKSITGDPQGVINQRNIIWNNLKKYSQFSKEKFLQKKYLDNAFKHSIYLIDIKKDVIRTYPNNPSFNDKNILYIKLQSILNAYANHNKNIGYAQGMNFILSKIVQRGYNEEECFLYFDAIISKLQMDHIYGFGELNKLPQIMKHISKLLSTHIPEFDIFLDNYSLTHEFCIANWVITLFSSSTFDEDLYMIWDYIFIFGWKFIYFFIVAIIKVLYKSIISFSFEEFSERMKTLLFDTFHQNSIVILNLTMKLMIEENNEDQKKNASFIMSMKKAIEPKKKEVITKPKDKKPSNEIKTANKTNNAQTKESSQKQNIKPIQPEVIEPIQKQTIESKAKEPIEAIQKEVNESLPQEVIVPVMKETTNPLQNSPIEPLITEESNILYDPFLTLQTTLLNQDIKSLKDCLLTSEYEKEEMKSSYDKAISQLKETNIQYESQINTSKARVKELENENNKIIEKMTILKQNVMKVKERLDEEVYPKLELKTKLLKETMQVNEQLEKKIALNNTEEINIKTLEEQMRMYRDKFNEGLKERIEIQHLANKQESTIKNYEMEIASLQGTIQFKEDKYKELDKAYISILRVIEEHKKTIRNLNSTRNNKVNEMKNCQVLLSQKDQEIHLLRSFISSMKKDNSSQNDKRVTRNGSTQSHRNLKPIKSFASTKIGSDNYTQENNNYYYISQIDTNEDDAKIKDITDLMDKLLDD